LEQGVSSKKTLEIILTASPLLIILLSLAKDFFLIRQANFFATLKAQFSTPFGVATHDPYSFRSPALFCKLMVNSMKTSFAQQRIVVTLSPNYMK